MDDEECRPPRECGADLAVDISVPCLAKARAAAARTWFPLCAQTAATASAPPAPRSGT
eukprot:CAMPEP_0172710448 /NCGR_PEP_ID=MMETSP1074-20121228/55669_1 /TAXON_ID=2916 /ORGANISM="Ceratium fusus, Strain PA161109" /LENGTH=57 /DNA_ID=CAMNT_0013533853 /DNA_START=120 /DNA_END=289 /DNA_ORIENTATION=+